MRGGSKMRDIALSVEELGMAAILINEPDFARSLIFSVYGIIEDIEAKSRLLAAGNSLISKNLVYFDGKQIILAEELFRIMRVLTAPDYSIKISRLEEKKEIFMAYHFKSNEIIKQNADDGYIYHLGIVTDKNDVIQYANKIFPLIAKKENSSNNEVFPYYILEYTVNVKNGGEKYREYFIKNGLSENTATRLEYNLNNIQYKGAAMKIEYTEESAISEKGFLVLGSKDDSLIFRLFEKEGLTMVEMQEGNNTNLEYQIRELME